MQEAAVCRLVASCAKELVLWMYEKIAGREGINCIAKAGLWVYWEPGGGQQLFC